MAALNAKDARMLFLIMPIKSPIVREGFMGIKYDWQGAVIKKLRRQTSHSHLTNTLGFTLYIFLGQTFIVWSAVIPFDSRSDLLIVRFETGLETLLLKYPDPPVPDGYVVGSV